MSTINVSEEDFSTVAEAACNARDDGNAEAAQALDKIARKINAALTASRYSLSLGRMMGLPRHTVRWEDMPSVLEETPR